MTKINVFEIRPSHIYYKDTSGDVIVRPNNPYWHSRLIDFDDDRIKSVVSNSGDVITVQETFNPMIFNITLQANTMNETITTRQIQANNVTRNLKNFDALKGIWMKYDSIVVETELLDSILEQYNGRVVFYEDESEQGYVIDDIFFVSSKGTAYVWKKSLKQGGESQSNLPNGNATRAICIVVNSYNSTNIRTAAGTITLDPKGFEVLSKIAFLLNPNLKDKTFMDQVPEETRQILRRQDPTITTQTQERLFEND
jgi:hypothetical protein